MPKIGELWRNKQDGRIVKIVNISTGFKGRTFLHILAYNSYRRTTVSGEDVLVLDSSWHQNWEKYEHDDSSGSGSSSVSTPKKSLALFPDGPLDKWRKRAASEKAPNTVKKAPRGGVPPLPLRSRPQDKDGGVDPNHPNQQSGTGEQRRLFREGDGRAYRSGPRPHARQHQVYMSSSDDEDYLELDTGPGYETQEQAVTRNLALTNCRWILTREFNGNIGNKKIEIHQEVVVIGQRSSAQTGGPALIHCKYKSFLTGQLSIVYSWVLKDHFIDGTFIFRAWGLGMNDVPPNPPSYEAARRQQELREDFGFFKNNINIKF